MIKHISKNKIKEEYLPVFDNPLRRNTPNFVQKQLHQNSELSVILKSLILCFFIYLA